MILIEARSVIPDKLLEPDVRHRNIMEETSRSSKEPFAIRPEDEDGGKSLRLLLDINLLRELETRMSQKPFLRKYEEFGSRQSPPTGVCCYSPAGLEKGSSSTKGSFLAKS